MIHFFLFPHPPAINLQSYPVFGIYQPRAIKYFKHNGVSYLVTANEGDSKDYDFFSEEKRVEELTLSENFGRLCIHCFRLRDNSVHLHEWSLFWVDIYSTIKTAIFTVYVDMRILISIFYRKVWSYVNMETYYCLWH